MEKVLEEVVKCIDWLKANVKGQNIDGISKTLANLSINSFYLAEQLADAYEEMNNAEHAYKEAVNDYQFDKKDEPVSKSKIEAEATNAPLRGRWKLAENRYKKLQFYMHAIENILDQFRTRISYLKTEKNTNEQT
ncbi:MAG TPA: hypothetical protein VLB84_17210 [Bacteroidia bacterium]|nr:hypothetical protein [Bacteroidia bacterium]